VKYSSREDWELIRAMYERGWHFTYYRHHPEWSASLRYPEGPPLTEDPVADFRHVTTTDLRRLLDEPGMTKEVLWERLLTLYREQDKKLAAALQKAIEESAREKEEAKAEWAAWAAEHIEVGWGRDVAGRWKDDSVGQAWGRGLGLVLARFPEVPWARLDEEEVARREKSAGCANGKLPPLPGWYRDALKVCSGPAMWPDDAEPPPGGEVDADGVRLFGSLASVRFGGAGLSSWMAGSPGDYYLYPGARFGPEDVETIAKWGLLPIGDNASEVLAIALYDPEDRHIYQFAMSTLWEDLSYDDDFDDDEDYEAAAARLASKAGPAGLELPPLDRVTPERHPESFVVFRDWWDMWSHVVSITYDPATFKRLPLKKLPPDLRRLHRQLRR